MSAIQEPNSVSWDFKQILRRILKEERGSASVEMVIFAMPLFIPLILLASHAASVSSSKIEISHLARTSLRAFVSAPSTPLGHARIQQVLLVAEGRDMQARDIGLNLSSPHGTGSRFSYRLECRNLPCIQPSNRVRITIEDRKVGTSVAATLNTDQWIQGEPGYQSTHSRPVVGHHDVVELEEKIAPFLDAKELIDQAREILGSLPGRNR